MGIGIKFKTATFALPSAKIYAEDKVLESPSGVIGLFDSTNSLSYPNQGAPTVTSKYWLNRAPSPAVAQILLGTQAPPATPATDTTTPTFVDSGFLMNSAQTKRIAGASGDFNFISTSFLATCWFVPNAAYFSKSGTQGIIGRWGGFGTSSWYLYGDGTANGMTGFVRYDASTFDTVGIPGLALQSGVLAQVGMSVEFLSANSVRLKTFFNGEKKGEATFAKGSLFNTASAAFCVGGATEDAQAANGVFKRVFIENLTISGRSPEARVIDDYLAFS
jgi:hypothetical protein